MMANGGPVKWHGGKSYFASRFWDIALSTDWRPIHVVEPYCGGAAFTLEGLARDLPFSFVVNDINRQLTLFWQILQCPVRFEEFRRRVEATPFSEWEYEDASKQSRTRNDDEWSDPVERAVLFFIRNRQSLAGRMTDFTGITRTRVRRDMNAEVSAWLTTVDGLPEFHRLLRKVLIFNRPALEVIASEDTPNTLFYLDPPYLHATRATTGEYGDGEMTDDQHDVLLTHLLQLKGRFMLSGYRSEMYDDAAKAGKWTRHDFEIANSAAGGKSKRKMTESLWVNW